jgi:hypothetical protein
LTESGQTQQHQNTWDLLARAFEGTTANISTQLTSVFVAAEPVHEEPIRGVVDQNEIAACHDELRARRVEAAVVYDRAPARRLPLRRIHLRSRT